MVSIRNARLFVCYMSAVACLVSPLEERLRGLDDVISHREDYAAAFEHRVDSLRLEILRTFPDSLR